METVNAYRLIVRTPGGQAHEFPLVQDVVTVGRGHDCDLVVESPYVSRQHARLVREGDSYHIADEGSTNGVLLNGKRVPEQQPLNEGDRIEIADITMDFTAKELGETTITPLLPGTSGELFRCDSATWQVWMAGEKLEPRLSLQEFELLSSLATRQGRICSREELGAAIWGEANFDHNMLHRLVHRLRDKLGPTHRSVIESVPGVGYRIALEAEGKEV